MSQSDDTLFQHEHSTEPCPLCGSVLQIKTGKNGPFLGCSNYPTCNYLKALHPHENTVVKVLEDQLCPECGSVLTVKNGRYGMFIGCSNYPDCHFIVHADEPEPSDLACPECKKGQLLERTSKYGKSFYGCSRYPDCKYLLNFKPVAGPCQFCAYPLLMEKPATGAVKLLCASKKCQKIQSG
jgi:putative DNA topoisomerase